MLKTNQNYNSTEFNSIEKDIEDDLFDFWWAENGTDEMDRDSAHVAWSVAWLGGWKRGFFLGLRNSQLNAGVSHEMAS